MHMVFALQRSIKPTRAVCLALQGGGGLGAYTWGVLDALLREEVTLEAVSGASAGAVNAVVMADGLIGGDRAHALERLSRFWRAVSDSFALGSSPAAAAALSAFDLLSMRPSPALVNPFGLNPLRKLLSETVDFERLRRERPIKLFISATRVRDGSARIFREHEVTLDVVLASACLPQFHDAVEIDGEAYWDGGYSANPPIMELVRATKRGDLLVVELTTALQAAGGVGGKEIDRRLRNFALSAPLQRELETLSDLQRMCLAEPAARSRLAHRLRALQVWRLSAQADHAVTPALNPLDLNWATLTRLADLGRNAGERWIAQAVREPGRSAGAAK